jgi:DNA-binding NarL/FixJ family response regulator
MNTIRTILICDDHALFGAGLKQLLLEKNHEVTYVSNTEHCNRMLNLRSFDVFLCDLNIDKTNGFDFIEQKKDLLKDTQVFLITAYSEDYLIEKAEKKGFQGFLEKSATAERLFKAINLPKNSPFYISVEKKYLDKNLSEKNNFSPSKLLLSNQEKEIIKWVVFGLTSKDIGEKLFISKYTVDTHRRNINKKLQLQGISSLIRFAHENNIAD